MKKLITILCILFVSHFDASTQTPELVVDFIAGPQGSIQGRVFEFKGVLLYLGISQNGERALLQYDKSSDVVSTLLLESEIDGEFNIFWANDTNIIITTDIEGDSKILYRSRENDLSDLVKVHDAGDAFLASLRITSEDIIMTELYLDDLFNVKSDFLHVDIDNNVTTIIEDLLGYPNNFSTTTIDDFFILAPEENLIDNQSVLAFDLVNKEFLPFTDIISTYQECGLISRLYSFADRVLVYECESDFVYDYINGQNLMIEDGLNLLHYDSDTHLFYTNNNNDFIKMNKADGSRETLFTNIVTARGFFNHFIALQASENGLEMTYYDYEIGTPYTYETGIDSIDIARFSGFGVVPEGVHSVLYSGGDDKGIIFKINEEAYTEIDSVFNVGFNNRPVAYDEDIYFSYDHPVYGSELFFIDYQVSSTQNILNETSISISPNPAQNQITVKHGFDLIPFTTSIFDMNGGLVLGHIQGNDIDVSGLSSGVYVLQTTYLGGKIGVERFVVR